MNAALKEIRHIEEGIYMQKWVYLPCWGWFVSPYHPKMSIMQVYSTYGEVWENLL